MFKLHVSIQNQNRFFSNGTARCSATCKLTLLISPSSTIELLSFLNNSYRVLISVILTAKTKNLSYQSHEAKRKTENCTIKQVNENKMKLTTCLSSKNICVVTLKPLLHADTAHLINLCEQKLSSLRRVSIYIISVIQQKVYSFQCESLLGFCSCL